MLLTIGLLLVVVFAKVLSHHGGGPADPQGRNVSLTTTDSTTPGSPDTTEDSGVPIYVDTRGTMPTDGASDSGSVSDSPTVLPDPVGDCSPSDIVVSPTVGTVAKSGAIDLPIELHTSSSVACSWLVSNTSLQVKVTSHSDTVWSTVDCIRAVPTETVVVRRDSITTVDVTWDGRYSQPGCDVHTNWAKAGKYHVVAAPLGGQPASFAFALAYPPKKDKPSVVSSPSATTSTSASSSTSASGEPSKNASKQPGKTASKTPSDEPSKKPVKKTSD